MSFLRSAVVCVAAVSFTSFLLSAHVKNEPTFSSGHPQEKKFAVKGVIVDQQGAPLRAEVVFNGAPATNVGHTDESGSVNLNLEAGKYVVTVSAVGFLTTKLIDFSVPGPTANDFRVVLKFDPVNGTLRRDRYSTHDEVPTVSSEPPNIIKDEPIQSSLPVTQPATRKRRSARCLYLWRCSASQP